jgi:hypothetical protein
MPEVATSVVDATLLLQYPVVHTAVVLEAVRIISNSQLVVWAVETSTAPTVNTVKEVAPQKAAQSALRAVALDTATNVPWAFTRHTDPTAAVCNVKVIPPVVGVTVEAIVVKAVKPPAVFTIPVFGL